MTQRETLVRLDTPQARDAFRTKYDDSVFRTAYAITGSHREAQQLTQALFEDVEKSFARKSLPDTPELYLLSRIHLIYARGEWRRQKVTEPAAFSPKMRVQQTHTPDQGSSGSMNPGAEVEAVCPGSVLLGQVVYIPQGSLTQAVPAVERVHRRRRRVVIPTAEEPAAAGIPAAIAVPAEEIVAVPEAVIPKGPEPAAEIAQAEETEPAAAAVQAEKPEPAVKDVQAEKPEPAAEAVQAETPAPAVATASAQEPLPARTTETVTVVPKGNYDPEMTEMWTPDMDEPDASAESAHRRPAGAGAPPKAEKPAAAQADMPAQRETTRAEERALRRSPLLTGFNVLLTLGAIGAAAYLVMSLNLF